jgi:hypothetical protein
MFALIRNEAEQERFRFVPGSSVLGWRSLSRVKMNVLRTPLTELATTVNFNPERPPRRP